MIRLHVHPHVLATQIIADLKVLSLVHPGEHAIELVSGERSLELGPLFRYDGSADLAAELEPYGRVEVLP